MTSPHVRSGLSFPDYAVVAQKRAPDEQMSLFDQAFNKDYGLTIDDLALLYAKKDQQLAAYEHDRWQWLESEWNTAKVRIDQQAGEIFALKDRATQLEAQLSEKSQDLDDERKKAIWLESEWNASKVRIEDLNLELQSVYSSRCWRITAPLRAGARRRISGRGRRAAAAAPVALGARRPAPAAAPAS